MKKITFIICSLFFTVGVLNAQTVLNGNFETWEINNYFEYPDGWVMYADEGVGNQLVEKSMDAKLGSFSIKLNTLSSGSDAFGVVIYGIPGEGSFRGMPFSGLGNSFHFWYKCDIQPNDTGMVWLMLYKEGVTIDSLIVPIIGTKDVWTSATIPVNSSLQQPDSMFLAFSSSIPSDFGGNPLAGSWLMVDDVYFTLDADPTPIPVPNFSFENWSMASAEDPANWETSNSDLFLILKDTSNVIKTLDANTGTYAARINVIEIDGDKYGGKLRYSQPITYAPEKIIFQYKYFPFDNDNAVFFLEFFKNNIQVGGSYHQFTEQTTNYTQQVFNLDYYDIPDSLSIMFESGENPGTYLIIDDLKFSCAKPNSLYGHFTSETSALLTWTAGSVEDEWLVEWGEYGFSQGSGTFETVNSTPQLAINGISGGISYQFYVKSICDIDDESGWVGPYTVCVGINAPVNEGFEGTDNGQIPLCWNKNANNPSNVQVNDNMMQAHDGMKFLEMTMQQNKPCFFVSPQIQDDFSTLMVSFYAMKSNWSNDARIKLGTMSNPSDPTTFTELATYDLNSNDYTNYEYYLNQYTGSDKHIAFSLVTDEWQAQAFLDDILIDFLPSCIPPINIEADNITTSSADLNWEAGGSEVLWNIVYGEIGFDPNTQGSPDNGISPPYNLFSLSSGTSYDVYLQSDCDIEGLSNRIKYTFATLCAPLDVPINEEFEGNYTSELPNCWLNLINGWGQIFVTYGGNNSEKAVNLRINNEEDSLYLITPEILPNIDELFITFEAYYPTGNPILTLGTISNPADVETFTPIQTIALNSNYQQFQYLFDSYTGGDNRIAFQLKTEGNNYTEIFIDNINIIYPPSCIQALGIELQDATTNSLDISWEQSGSQSSWNLICVLEGDNNWMGNTPIVCSSPACNLTSLSMGTSYDIYIQSVCGVDLSTWSKVTFSTLCGEFSVPVNENFENTANNDIPNCWSSISANGSSVHVVNWMQSTSNPNSLRMQWQNEMSKTYFISPELTNAISQLYISFNAKANSPNNPNITIGTMTDPSNESTFTPLITYQANHDFQSFSYTFDTYSGSDHYIALKLSENNNDNTEIFIDDILIDVPPTCIKPQSVNVNPTSATANVTWQPGDEEQLWNLIYAYQWENDWLNNGTLIEGIDTTQYTISGLQFNENYNVYLQSDCGSGELSYWTTAYSFHTPCNNITAPYNYDFDDTDWWMMPMCWQNIQFHSDMNAYSGLKDVSSHSPNNHIYLFNGSNADPYGFLMMITPPLENVNDKQIRFFAKTTTNGTSLKIGSMNNQSDPNSFNLITTFNLTETYTEYTVPLNAISGDIHIAFSHGMAGAGDNREIFIDDFVFEAACASPSTLNTLSVTSSGATVDWTSLADNFEIEYGIAPYSFTGIANETGIITNSFNFSSLSPNTTYQYRVRGLCGINESEWSNTGSFTTLCEPEQIPYYQNFESTTPPQIPNCNRIENAGQGNDWKTTSNPGFGFTNNTLIYEANSNNADAWYFTQGVDLIGGTTYSISFRHGNNSTVWAEKMKVAYGDAPTSSAMSNLLFDFPEINLAMSQNATQYFTPATSGTYFFGFNAYSLSNQYYLFVDDIAIEIAPPCHTPTNLTASSITNDAANLSWNNTSGAPQFQLEWGEQSFALGTGNSIFENSTSYSILGGLLSATSYEYYVRAICGENDTSAWAGPYLFATHCDVVTEFYENFDNLSNYDIPYCWEKVTSTGNVYSAYYNPYSSPNSLDMVSANPSDVLVISMQQVSNANANTHWLKFMAKASPGANFQVGYLDPFDENTFVLLQMIQFSDNQYHQYTVNPGSLPGINTTFAFKSIAPPSALVSVDDVSWEAKPDCPGPDMYSVVTSNETLSSVDIQWTELGAATQWEIEYGIIGQGFTNTVTANTNPFTLTNLTHSSFYQFQIKSICTSEESDWKGPFYFSTTCGVFTLPFSENFNTTHFNTIPYCWNRSVNNWFANNSNQAGGNSPELVFGRNPQEFGKQIAITPLIDASTVSSLMINFKHSLSNFPGNPYSIGVEVTTDDLNWTSVWSMSPVDNIYPEEITINISSYAGQTIRLAWVFDGNSHDIDSWNIDDIFIDQLPTCPKPIQLSSAPESSTSVMVQWTEAGNANTWQIEWGMHDFALGNGFIFDVSQPSHLFYGLAPGAYYDYYVRAICGDGDTSIWSGPHSFYAEYTCSANTIYGQTPNPLEYLIWSSQEANSKVHQNFANINSPFDGVHLWGALRNEGGECYSDPIDLEVTFYNDNNGNIGTPVTSFIVPVAPDSLFYSGSIELYEFIIQFPEVIQLSEGWFSVQSVNSPSCYLLIANTTNPATYGHVLRVRNMGNDTTQHNPLGFCFINNSHTVNYSAGQGGNISGQQTQIVSYDGNTTPITALPEPCFEFSKWSDDSTDNPREDNHVITDFSVTAIFVPINYDSTMTVEICQGDVFVLGNQILTSQGEYSELFQTENNCDSTVYLSLVVNPIYEFETDSTICNGDVISWQGSDYNIAGTYYDSLMTFLGCDSILVLNLSVNPTYEFVTDSTICNGDLISWQGSDYNIAGTYYDSLMTFLGCDSILVLNLSVNPTYEFVTDFTICNGDVINWQGGNYNIAGTYYDSLMTILGCDSILVLNLSVNPIYEFVTDSVICDGDVISWQGGNYNIAGTYYDSLMTILGCDSILVLNLSVNPIYEFVTDTVICDGDIFNWQGNNYSVAGTYYDSLLTIFGCDSVHILHLEINNLPLVSISGLDDFYCSYANPVSMIGTPSGGTFSGQGVSGNIFDPSAAGYGLWPIVYEYTDANICSNSDTVFVEVDECVGIGENIQSNIKIYPNPTTGIVNIEFSQKEKIIIEVYNVTGQMIYRELFSDTNTTQIDLSASPAGMYYVKITNSEYTISKKIVLNR